MKVKTIVAAGAGLLMLAGVAFAESFEDMCLRVSTEWGSTGDVAGQCSCLAGLAAENQSLADEITELAETYSSDAEAYEAASDAGKAAFDQCSVET